MSYDPATLEQYQFPAPAGTSNQSFGKAPQAYSGSTAVMIERSGQARSQEPTAAPSGVQVRSEDSGERALIGQRGPGADPNSVVATARAPWGRALAPSEIKADSVVTVGGIETSARNAERMGLLVRDAGGFFRDPTGASAGTPQGTHQAAAGQPAEAPQAPQIEALDGASESILSSFSASVQPGNLIAASLSFINDGAVSADALSQIASQSGMDIGEARERVEHVVHAFAKQGAAALQEASGLPGEFAAELLQKHFPEDYRRAAHSLFMEGNTGQLRELATRATTLAIASIGRGESTTRVEAAPGSDITVFTQNKVPMVNIPGAGTMSIRTAIKAGLVVVSQ